MQSLRQAELKEVFMENKTTRENIEKATNKGARMLCNHPLNYKR